jgi:hypothetical protein
MHASPLQAGWRFTVASTTIIRGFPENDSCAISQGLPPTSLSAQLSELFLGVQLDEEPKPSLHHVSLGPEPGDRLCPLEKVRIDIDMALHFASPCGF